MRKLIALLVFASTLSSLAAEYTLDFTGAKMLPAEAPVTRKAEMAVAIGQIPSVAVGDRLNLKLFDDVAFALEVVSAPPAGIAGQSFIARDQNGPASAIVDVEDGTARIAVDDFMNLRQYVVRSSEGKTFIVEIDNSHIDGGECATCSGEVEPTEISESPSKVLSQPVKSGARMKLGTSGNEFPLATQKSVIDVLVVFDQGAKAWALDTTKSNQAWVWNSIEKCAKDAVARMNEVVENSRNDDLYYFRLVGVTEVDASYDNIDQALLNAVSGSAAPFGKLPYVGTACGADVIVTFVNVDENRTSYNTGVAWGLEYGITKPYIDKYIKDYGRGYAICHIQRSFREYTMAHEVGHTMGAGHSNMNVNFDRCQTVEYSCGYHFTSGGTKYRTIMGYNRSRLDGGGGYWYAAPYFSEPAIPTNKNGVAVYEVPIGTVISNDNRRVLRESCAGISTYVEHKIPYDWDVRFFDENGVEITGGTCFSYRTTVSLNCDAENAKIYYTTDGTTPNASSKSCDPGNSIQITSYTPGETKILTACAVVSNTALSMRSITLTESYVWSGESGANGNGVWKRDEARAWNDSSKVYSDGEGVVFPDIEGVESAVVTVKGAVAPASVAFTACETEYTFDAGDDDAKITIPNANFAPVGNLTFNVPVQLEATTFTNMTGRTLTFNAPFGQTVDATSGYCTNMIGIGENGILTVAPGAGKTQTFDKFSTSTYYSTSVIRFGEGTTIFKSKNDSGHGVLGNVQVVVDSGANLIFDEAAGTGSSMTSDFTVEKGGTVTFNGAMEHMQRSLYLKGGTLICNHRFDKMNAYGIAVTDDSEIKGNGYMLLRYNDEPVNVAAGKTLTLNIPTKTGPNTDGVGLIKRGDGEIVANQQLEHSGATTIEGGSFTVGYTSTDSYGTGWSVASGAKLKVNVGGALTVPALATESGSTLSLPVSATTSLTVNGELDLAGVILELMEGGKYSGGDRFTIITATGGLSNFDEGNVTSTPALADGLKWEFDVTDNSVVAWIKDYGELKNELKFLSNNSGLNIKFTKDAKIGSAGGIVIDENPLVVDGLSTKAVAITLDVDIPETTLTEEATICSWKVNDGYARCVRRIDGYLDCYHGTSTDHVKNSASERVITPGRHTITIAYYSSTDDTHSGTFVYLDNQLAYRAYNLRWTKEGDAVNRITVGGTAYNPSTRIYKGLVVYGFAVIDALSNDPIPNVTASSNKVKYEYMTQGHPCVFALPPAGGFMLDSSILRATIGSERYDSVAVSLVASFPADETGTIVGLCLSDGYLVTFQVEYVGNRQFMLRPSDYSIDSATCNNIDVTKPHLYTIAFDGSVVTFSVDGNQTLESDMFLTEMEIVNEIDFGCGYWNSWEHGANNVNNPNPLAGLKVYASDIKLGTDDTSASESKVMSSLNFDSKYFAGMTLAQKLAYLEEQQTANGVVPPVSDRLPVVDILVAFDNGGVDYVSDTGKTLEGFAEEQIAKMNDVLATNQLDATYSYRLAGVCTVNTNYTDINATVSLIQEGAGPCTTLRAAREMYGADTVTLLVDTTGSVLGHSSQPNYQGDMAAYHDDCFSVCSISAVDTGDQHTMIHENAHNLGCGHAREQYTAQDIAEHPGKYSYGYYFKDGNVDRHTIMAYSVANDKYYQPSPYFSTSSDEFGMKLGDATNDNARVIRDTCGYVANWRESIKPFDGDVTVYDYDTGDVLLSGHIFAGSVSVALMSADGRAIYYTLDGTNPTKDSAVYSGPIDITADTTITVASLDGKTLRPPRTVRLFRIDSLGASIAEGVSWRTNVKYPWIDLGDGVIRSHNHTDYSYNCTTPLVATITGPKRLHFNERSYFFGITPSQGSRYSHYEVLVDDVAQVTEEACEKTWKGNYVDIPAGIHEVAFVYSQRSAYNDPKSDFMKNGGEPDDDDAVWLQGFTLEDVECAHSSSSPEVSWTFPDDAKLTDDFAHGVLINSKGVANDLSFATNGVCASALATLPENKVGAIAGCKVYRSTKGQTFYAFAYSNGDGTFSLCHDNHQVAATSSVIADWAKPHVWTFAFGAQAGAKLYCDGVEIVSTTSIQWSNTDIVTPITFGNDPSGNYPLNGMKIYAVHTAFGTNGNILGLTTASASVKATFESIEVMAPFAEDSLADQLYTFTNYRDTGVATPRLADGCALRISEIMPKPTDALEPGAREGMDVNGLESGWVEVENTSDRWADLADYKFTRANRGKKSNQADYGNFPSRLVPPHGRAIFYTSERYDNSADMKESAWATADSNGAKPKLYGADLGNILVWPDKVNPKKSPFVRLTYTPENTIVDTVIIPSDVPEGCSIIVGETVEGEATKRWLCPTPTRGKANTDTTGLKRIGPNVGPLYEISGGKGHDSANEFARVAPPAKAGENYEITFSLNPVMSPTVAADFRPEDAITNIVLVYRTDLTNDAQRVSVDLSTDKPDPKDWGHTYKVSIPAADLPAAGHLIQWKFNITDASGNTWTSPSFNNPDDGYEWYGTIVEAPELESATLPTWHMFAAEPHLTEMDYDTVGSTSRRGQNKTLVPNYARIAIYDSSTSNYYDYVRIDLRGNTSKDFSKKSHGLRFAKAHPLTMTDVVTGGQIKEIRKTSLISEYADPSYMRQMVAFWLWSKMGNKVPFDFPVRCNLNGEFYQLAFNSERFTDELIEDVYKFDKYGYSYKNVGTLNKVGTSAGNIEKKTPDDENETDTSVLEESLINPLKLKGAAVPHGDGESSELTKFVVEKFNLPAWINYLASARITQEMDDVWANVCAYYDNAAMTNGVRGTDTWMPLGYDFNLSFGQYYIADLDSGALSGLSATNDWYKSHPLYGGWTIRARKKDGGELMDGNNGFEAVYQSPKFRRLYLRRLRTLMDQELKEPGATEGATPFMFEMRKLANLMRADATKDQTKWPNDGTDNKIDVWTSRPANMDAGIQDIWNNYVVPRRQHLYVTHSITNTAWGVGYASDKNAGIPEAQSPFENLIGNMTIIADGLASGVVVISNLNNEVVDMSGWTLDTGKKWTLPVGTVCDSNDCIYVVSDRRQYIKDHASGLTDQVIVGNATFGAGLSETPLSYPETDTSSGTVSVSDEPVVFEAKTAEDAAAWVESLTPELTAEQKADNLTTDHFIVEAKKVPGETGKYQVVLAVNPSVDAPEIAAPTSDVEPVKIEDDKENPDKKKVSVSISNAIRGLWYGYEVANELGDSADFANDVGSFERAESKDHTVTGSPRSAPSGFFRLKVLPAKP